MAFFLSELVLTPWQGTKWKLVAPLSYIRSEGNITVPDGFTTDLASIPRIIRPLIPIHGKHTRGAVLHDYLYEIQKINDEWITRKQADDIFYDAMLELGVNRFKARIMWSAVRSFGWIHFNKRSKKIGNPL